MTNFQFQEIEKIKKIVKYVFIFSLLFIILRYVPTKKISECDLIYCCLIFIILFMIIDFINPNIVIKNDNKKN